MKVEETTPLIRPSSRRSRENAGSTTVVAAGAIAFLALTGWLLVAASNTTTTNDVPSTSDRNLDTPHRARLGWWFHTFTGHIARIITRCERQDCKGVWDRVTNCNRPCGGGNYMERWRTTEIQKCGGGCPNVDFWNFGKTRYQQCNTHTCPSPPPPPPSPPSPPPPLPPPPPHPRSPPIAPNYFLDTMKDFLKMNRREVDLRLCSL